MTLKYLVVLLLLIVMSALCLIGLISQGVNLNSQKLSLRNNTTSHTYNQSINAIKGSENEEDITDLSEGEPKEDETDLSEKITENLSLETSKTTNDEKHNNELSLIVIGDFGYTDKDKPNAEQRRLGELVANRVANSQTKYDFMLSVGDNVYPLGLESFEDKKADVIFEDTFQMSALGLDWYSVLGNHDLIGDMEAALRLSERFPLWKQTEPYYYETFNIGNSSLKAAFVFMHSPDLVCRNRSTFECYKNIQKNIKFDQIQTQIDWLNETLSSLSSDNEIVWKIVVIHNAIFSAGKKHGDDKDIKELVLPLLVKYKVDVVLSGHDHSVQYLRMDMQNNNQEESAEKKEDNQNECSKEPDFDYCSKNEFFYYELTKCGEIKKLEKNNYMKSAFYDNNEQVLNILDSKYSRLSTANQEEYLHQFVMGNGGIKHEELCPVKQMKSEGKLRYGHTISGVGEIRIKEDKLDVSLISVDNELLYSLSIFRSDVNTVKQN